MQLGCTKVGRRQGQPPFESRDGQQIARHAGEALPWHCAIMQSTQRREITYKKELDCAKN